MNTDIEELGYNRGEIKTEITAGDHYVIGYCELLTNKLIAIHRFDNKIMSNKEIASFYDNIYFSNWEESSLLEDGIKYKNISQEYIESVCKCKAKNEILKTKKYVFRFKEGWLIGFRSRDGISPDAKDYLYVDSYISESKDWYHGDQSAIAKEINLHAECFVNIDINVIRSNVIKNKFSYRNGCCNYIAVAAYFKHYNVDFRDLLNSFHGDYAVIEDSPMLLRVKAYGVTFTNIREQPLLTNKLVNSSYEEKQGYIYVMINQTFPNVVKIGKTTRDPNERVKELSAATGVPTPFMLAYYREFNDCHTAEKVIHGYLERQGMRVNNNREFFQISTTEAIQLIDTYYQMDIKQK